MIRETFYCTKSLDHAMLILPREGHPLPSDNAAVTSTMHRGQRPFAGADIFRIVLNNP